MELSILHELPGRLRLRVAVPTWPTADREQVEANLHDLAGLRRVTFSPRTATLLVHYDGGAGTREAVLRRVAAAPPPGRRRPQPPTGLDRKKKTVLRAGTLLLCSPLIPVPVKPFLAFSSGLPVLKKGMASLANRRIDVDVLDASAIGAAMATRDYLTASAIAFLLKLGDYLDEWTRKRSRKLLSRMFHTEEEWAWVVRNGEERRVSMAEVTAGDELIVRMGSLIPVDGTVVGGEALVNQASMTGEGLPVMKEEGQSVYAGTVVEEGTLRVRAVKIGGQTRAARVVKIIEESEALKAETQSHSEKLADKVVPYSFLLSGLTFALTGNPARAASVLLIDYSCAIKLSTPLAVLASLARAARHRVLIKGGRYLEELARADAFILDKTGTLTEAAPEVAGVLAFNGYTEEYVLSQAACVEEHFPHPVATAVVRDAARNNLPHPEEHAEVEYVLAHGIVSRVHGNRILVGSRHFVSEDEGVDVSVAAGHIAAFADQGYSVLYVVIGRELAGLIAIRDPLRPDARAFIDRLRGSGITKIVMLTGDNEATAKTVAGRLGIADYYAQALPEKKVEIVERLRKEGYTVAMVGDGINDSPALARADVGISMKHGADIAKEACDVLLMEGTLDDLLTARSISREAMALIRQNFRLIVAINSAALAMALTGLLPPIFSALLHNAGTIGVGLNALKPLGRQET